MPKCKKYYKNQTKYKEYIARNKQRNYKKGRENCYKHQWNYDEICLIMNSDYTDRELSQFINHSVNAIQKKRWEMRKELNLPC